MEAIREKAQKKEERLKEELTVMEEDLLKTQIDLENRDKEI